MDRSTTPDGVPLAGWWHRVGALLIDWVLVSVLISVLGRCRGSRDIWHSYRDLLDEAFNDGRNGTSSVDTTQFQRDIAGPAAVVALISLAVEFCYHVGLPDVEAGHPGQARRRSARAAAGEAGTDAVRHGGAALARPVRRAAASAWSRSSARSSASTSLLDYLWPLWDDKKQAIHDKLAKTNVVRVR